MTLSNQAARSVVERYVHLVAHGTAAEVAELYAPDATVEDPVGGTPISGHDAIREFYGTFEALETRTQLVTLRACGGQAAFHFVVETVVGDQVFRVEPLEVMTFDDEGRITAMRAWWSEEDTAVGPAGPAGPVRPAGPAG